MGRRKEMHNMAGVDHEYKIPNGILTSLLKNDAFLWNDSTQEAFQQLKKVMTTPPVLSLLDFTKGFEIECDASSVGIGVLLMQFEKLIAFLSQVLKSISLSIFTYDKELFALIVAVKK